MCEERRVYLRFTFSYELRNTVSVHFFKSPTFSWYTKNFTVRSEPRARPLFTDVDVDSRNPNSPDYNTNWTLSPDWRNSTVITATPVAYAHTFSTSITTFSSGNRQHIHSLSTLCTSKQQPALQLQPTWPYRPRPCNFPNISGHKTQQESTWHHQKSTWHHFPTQPSLPITPNSHSYKN